MTLELGGKSPAIVSDSVPMKDAAERIAFGKSLNAGQTCVAPDYVLVPSRRVEEFVSRYKEVVQGFFPRLSDNPDYTAIINERQLGRLQGYLDDAREKGATLVPLFAEGQQRRLPQTLLAECQRRHESDAGGNLRPAAAGDPLRAPGRRPGLRQPAPAAAGPVLLRLRQGAAAARAARDPLGRRVPERHLLHVAQDDIPFGGVGPSGMGHYHGHEGFLTFSKAKGVFSKPRFNAARMIYPPTASRSRSSSTSCSCAEPGRVRRPLIPTLQVT
ncbi:aldehyde dehydrogenase [Pseudomonas aeruginosa]|nr:aldehyde dehydrogenase [Pseudomonas aeruginosa]